MIYDSIRQGKPSIRNNFGAGRLNNRLSFYFFEINRLSFIQRKSFHNHRTSTFTNKGQVDNNNLLYLSTIETTLFSYIFLNKDNSIWESTYSAPAEDNYVTIKRRYVDDSEDSEDYED